MRQIGLMVCFALTSIACQDLAIDNLNAPDRTRALSNPEDIEGLIGSQLRTWYWAVQDTDGPFLLSTMADEITSSWGNFGMQDVSSEPRRAWNNDPGYNYASALREIWYELYEAISNVNDGLAALADADIAAGLDAARPGENAVARARAFGKLVQALSHAYLAAVIDQGFIYREELLIADPELETTAFELRPHAEVMASALAMFDEAIALAESAAFDVPPLWVGNIDGFTNLDLARVASAYKARYLAGAARTPAERAAVDWAAVSAAVDYARGKELVFENGYGMDDWYEEGKYYANRFDWTRADQRLIGPADEGTAYAEWIATPVAERKGFFVTTSDRRIDDPDDACAHVDFAHQGCGSYFVKRFQQSFRAERGTYHYSNYGWRRFLDYRLNRAGTAGAPLPVLVTAELDMLKAEALLRTNPVGGRGEIVALINATRVGNGGLSPVTIAHSDDELKAALIHEKGIELATIALEVRYLDFRGWGYLVKDTPTHLPVPARELETLQLTLYTTGGPGGLGAASQTDCWVTGPTDAEGNACHPPTIPH